MGESAKGNPLQIQPELKNLFGLSPLSGFRDWFPSLLPRFLLFRAFVISLLALLAADAPGSQLQRFEYSEVAMGVRARIVAYAPSESVAARACRAAFERIAKLEDTMSDYRPASELMRLCDKAGGPPVKVGPDLLRILVKSQDLSRRSDGAFDVTVGPLVKLWRQARKTGKLPPPGDLEAARKLVGWQHVSIDPKASTVQLMLPGTRLDLGGIAKGYACDEAIRVLKSNGIASALVEMGGDIAVSGPPPGTKGWEIEVTASAAPLRSAAEATRRLILSHCGVSSSGDIEQFVEIGGKRYSHIVDPRTGLGLTNRVGVTVIARDATTSDGLSTAISVLGDKKGLALVKTYRGTRLFVRRAP